ncbi:DUF4489 domain-containing protein [Wukongibacter baidiensis]|uniref:DUF4489 domain-containing protein n=1 Tax=Wukongibacter baidiensis TaxID=1723361 RepID=UPI003D7FF437
MSGYMKKVSNKCDRKTTCDCKTDTGCAVCEPMHPFSKKIELVCGQGSRAAFTNANDPATIVGRVVVDTRDMDNPTVGIQFSSVIEFLALFTAAEARLDFELFRACDNGIPQRLKSWTYDISGIEGNTGDFDALRYTKSFNFNFCDFPTCSGCCEYFVQVSVVSISVVTVLVDNVYMTALVQ